MSEHPHPDKLHVLRSIRKHLLGMKRKYGTARGLGHYGALVQTYLTAKRLMQKEVASQLSTDELDRNEHN